MSQQCFYLQRSLAQKVVKLSQGAVTFILLVDPHLVLLEDAVRLAVRLLELGGRGIDSH